MFVLSRKFSSIENIHSLFLPVHSHCICHVKIVLEMIDFVNKFVDISFTLLFPSVYSVDPYELDMPIIPYDGLMLIT